MSGRISSHSTDNLQELAEAVVYKPSPAERRLKAKYWSLMDGALMVSEPTQTDINRTLGGNYLSRSWGKEGFREWFLNKEEGRARLEYLFDLGMDSLESILTDPDPKSNGAKVAAIKLLADITGRSSKSKPQTSGIADAIAGADKAALEAIFERQGIQVSLKASKGDTEPAIDVTPHKQ